MKKYFFQYKDADYLSRRGCKSYRTGDSCCHIICLDEAQSEKSDGANIIDNNGVLNLGSRIIISPLAAIPFLALLVCLIHRFRQRKIRGVK